MLIEVVEKVDSLTADLYGRDPSFIASICRAGVQRLAHRLIENFAAIVQFSAKPGEPEYPDAFAYYRFAVSVNLPAQAKEESKALDEAFALGMRHAADLLQRSASMNSRRTDEVALGVRAALAEESRMLIAKAEDPHYAMSARTSTDVPDRRR